MVPVSDSSQTAQSMNALNLPRPGWMTEDLVLLEEQARRFIADEFVPHLDELARQRHLSARRLDQGWQRRPPVRVDARGLWRRRRQLRA